MGDESGWIDNDKNEINSIPNWIRRQQFARSMHNHIFIISHSHCSIPYRRGPWWDCHYGWHTCVGRNRCINRFDIRNTKLKSIEILQFYFKRGFRHRCSFTLKLRNRNVHFRLLHREHMAKNEILTQMNSCDGYWHSQVYPKQIHRHWKFIRHCCSRQRHATPSTATTHIFVGTFFLGDFSFTHQRSVSDGRYAHINCMCMGMQVINDRVLFRGKSLQILWCVFILLPIFRHICVAQIPCCTMYVKL